MNNEQKKAFITEGREANTIHGDHADFWKLCVKFNEGSAFSKLWGESETAEDFENRILTSEDPGITLSQAYAELSKRRPDHWYRLRSMLGGRIKKNVFRLWKPGDWLRQMPVLYPQPLRRWCHEIRRCGEGRME